jgi:hypothetical protein
MPRDDAGQKREGGREGGREGEGIMMAFEGC